MRNEDNHMALRTKKSPKPFVDDLEEDNEDLEISHPSLPKDLKDADLEKIFDSGRLRVVQEKNDFFLPHVLSFIEQHKWSNLRPEYQRRLRWDDGKKSRLIESFIMNVPIPPIFLYEKSVGTFEVMDGQQRLNAVLEFLNGEFELVGLKIWDSLNGRTFKRLPPLIRRYLERSKLSAITLMSDSSMSEEDSVDLRAQVFERLNTGGERLNAQELRNSLYSGPFNRLVVELAADSAFTKAWNIPNHSAHTLSDGSPSSELRDDPYYKRMLDCEIVLRFFSFFVRRRMI